MGVSGLARIRGGASSTSQGGYRNQQRVGRSSSRTAHALFWGATILYVLACLPSRAAEPDGPVALIGPTEALRIAILNRVGKVGNEQKALADYYAVPDAQLLWVDENGLTSRA